MAQTQRPARILIYSATAGFRHDSIPTAIAALKANGSAINVEFDSTEDKTRFTVENLSQYDALLFLSTTGESAYNFKSDPRIVGAVVLLAANESSHTGAQ
ncbi:hypothetical protein C0993_000992 [Termitomyces sp. T159_Od127]|nr:hypothetical protein C0993_000992 [Termitomyces sp. T159_Od127]